MTRALERRPSLFVAFACEDLALARPVAEQLRGGAAPLWLDYSARHEPFDAGYAAYIRASVKLRISRCSATLCLLGAETIDDPWVRWTLATAKALGRPLLGAPLRGAPPAAADLLTSLGVEIIPLRPAVIQERLRDHPPCVTPSPSSHLRALDLTAGLFKRHLR